MKEHKKNLLDGHIYEDMDLESILENINFDTIEDTILMGLRGGGKTNLVRLLRNLYLHTLIKEDEE